MRYLLDTHTLVWSILEPHKLSKKAKISIKNTDNQCFVSTASIWEIGIKHAINRLDLKTDLPQFFKWVDETGYQKIAISTPQVLKMANLPFHHRDPFDRILIAQAQAENLTLITKDGDIPKYEVEILW